MIRGRIKCVRSIERKCGYIIRPELSLSTVKAGAARALESKGLEVRMVYSKPEEITSILNIIHGLEDLSATDEGLRIVRRFNGILTQPETHEDVKNILDLIESSGVVIG
tara:strand:- start:2590 stop:2916 length:327 start_codon:yes stop_codon:yes gene_type:complete